MIEDLIKAAILGIVQGLTEFLPVSSTGHLVLVEDLLGVDQDTYGLSFDAALHMGTLLALLAFFGMTWVRLIIGGLKTLQTRSFADPEGRLAWLIVLGTVPAGVLGFAFESAIEDVFRNDWLIATTLILFSGVFLIAEAIGKRTRAMDDMGWRDALIIGFAQSLALVPGVSRSGATICAGLVRDIRRPDAATFAFMLSAPIIAGAGLKQMVTVVRDFADGTRGRDDAAFFVTGMLCAAIVGYLSIAFLMRFLKTNTLRPFVYYRVGLGLVVYAVLITRLVV